MLRCVTLATALLAAVPAFAQSPRVFPANALRGEMIVVQPPEVLLNGQPARLAPGARIYDPHNLLQLSGALVGQRLIVNYTYDTAGQPLQVWVLTLAERANAPWPTNAAQAQTWLFDPAAQTWTVR